MTRSTVPPLVVVALLAACGLDFVGPESPTTYFVMIRFTDDASTATSIVAHLTPGIAPDGNPRQVLSDTIIVWDQTMVPIENHDDGTRRYEAEIDTDPRLGQSAISTTPPTVIGVATAPELRLDLVWREGPHAIEVRENTDVVLAVANTGGLLADDSRLNWTLSVTRLDGGTVYRASALGIPPMTITIPAAVIDGAMASALEAILEVSYSTRSEGICVGCSAYAAALLVFAELHWTLNLVAPSEELR